MTFESQADLLRAVADGRVAPVLPAHVEMALALAEQHEAERDEAIRQRDELRAILAPLLDAPIYRTTCEEPVCVFCRRTHDWEPDFEHAPDCPALPANRDRLLGRPPTDEGDSA